MNSVKSCASVKVRLPHFLSDVTRLVSRDGELIFCLNVCCVGYVLWAIDLNLIRFSCCIENAEVE